MRVLREVDPRCSRKNALNPEAPEKDLKNDADKSQADLEKNKATPLPAGKVSKEQKKAIFEQGVLNDVATCYWIKGRSALITPSLKTSSCMSNSIAERTPTAVSTFAAATKFRSRPTPSRSHPAITREAYTASWHPRRNCLESLENGRPTTSRSLDE